MSILNRVVWFLAFGLLMTPAWTAFGAEPAQEFIDALRERRMHDMAMEYLDRAESSPLVGQELKERIDYERALTQLSGAGFQGDFGLRESMLNDAEKYLNKFLRSRQGHPLETAARARLANLLEQRATMLVEKADSPSGAKDKVKLLKEADGLYSKAFKTFEAMRNDLKEELAQYPPTMDPRKDKEKIERRTEIRKEYLQARLISAVIKEEQAECYAKDSAEHKAMLEDALGRFGEVYKDYRKRLAGLYAFMYQGRCYQKLGKTKEALANFVDLLDQPDSPDQFRTLKTKVLIMAMESWMDPSQNKLAEAIQRGSDWVGKIRPNENSDQDWLKIRYLLATASRDYSDEVKKKNPKDPQVRDLISSAKKQAALISRHQGPYQDAAKKLVAELGGRKLNADGDKVPTNFVDAMQAGKDLLEAVDSAKRVLVSYPARIAKEKDEANKADLQKSLDEAKQTLATGRSQAIDNLRLAQTFVEDDTPLNDVNAVRYFLCFLYYEIGAFYDAAAIGEFVAQRYPDATGARDCAKIAMASYSRLYGEAPKDDQDFEVDRLIRSAQYIVDTWPDQEESEDAFAVLIPMVVKKGELDEAERLMKQIPPGSAKRAQAEMTTGQAMWGAYSLGMQAHRKAKTDETIDKTALQSEEELIALKTRAEKILADGVERMKSSDEATATTVTAGISLVQIYLDTDQAAKAVTLLEDEKVGPLVLVRKNIKGVTDDIKQLTLRTALRAYIASLATASDGAAVNTKAKGIMQELRTWAGDDEAGQKKLVGIYVSLATDLKDQIALLSNDTDAQKRLTGGFESFLDEVGGTTKELSILNWVADMFAAMAGGLNANDPSAAKYYEKSIATYDKIFAKEKAGELQVSDNLKILLRMKKASVLGSVNKFEEAIAMFGEILKDRPALLDVQMEAAGVYEQWAATEGNHEKYDNALKGGVLGSDKKPIIWGWIKLSSFTARQASVNTDPEKKRLYREQFFDARLKVAECHLKLAEKSAEKARYYEFAKKDITMTQDAYPDLGGKFSEFNELYRKIQGQAGENVTGLERKEVLQAVVEPPAPVEEVQAAVAAEKAKEVDIPPREPLSPTMQYVFFGGAGGVGLLLMVAMIFVGTRKKKGADPRRPAPDAAEPDFSKAKLKTGGAGGPIPQISIGPPGANPTPPAPAPQQLSAQQQPEQKQRAAQQKAAQQKAAQQKSSQQQPAPKKAGAKRVGQPKTNQPQATPQPPASGPKRVGQPKTEPPKKAGPRKVTPKKPPNQGPSQE